MSAFQHAASRLVSRMAWFVAPQRSTELLPESRLAKRDRARAKRQKAELLTSRPQGDVLTSRLFKAAC
jgi:hypothetical protein